MCTVILVLRRHTVTLCPSHHNSVQSHKKFKEKAGLPFMLLSDSKKEVARKFHNLRVRTRGGKG